MVKNKDLTSVEKTTNFLLDYDYHLMHTAPLDINVLLKNTALKITKLEDNNKLQKLVLNVFNCFVILSEYSKVAKIIRNQKDTTFVVKHQ